MKSETDRDRITEEAGIRMARQMAAQGISADVILNELTMRGMDRGMAVFIIQQHSGIPERQRKSAGLLEMLTGGLILGAGLAITIYTYMRAEQTVGGRFTLAYGAIIVGGAQFIRGLVKWSQR